MDRALFLDRDGTINTYGEYLYKMEQITFIEGIFEVVKRFNEAGWYVFVISNQAGVARGYYTEEDVKKLHAQMDGVISRHGGRIEKWYYCPHHLSAGKGEYRVDCNCRKPKTGMLDAAAREYNLNLKKCYLIGDNITDIECAKNAGMPYFRANGSPYRADEIFDCASRGVCRE